MSTNLQKKLFQIQSIDENPLSRVSMVSQDIANERSVKDFNDKLTSQSEVVIKKSIQQNEDTIVFKSVEDQPQIIDQKNRITQPQFPQLENLHRTIAKHCEIKKS